MKRSLAILALALFCTSIFAGEKVSKPLKEAHKATCSIVTYDDNGAMIGSGQGLFIGEEGELITSYELFRGATSAVTTDAAGVTRPAELVTGANELYNVIRVSVEPDKKYKSMPVDSVAVAEGERLYLLPVSTARKEVGEWMTVKSVEQVAGGYAYYTLSGKASTSDLAGRPLLNENGELAAMLQSSAEGDSLFYALDARYAADIEIKALSLNEPSYKHLKFAKSLPGDVEQAQVYLFVTGNQNDSESYAQVVDQFIKQFPDHFDGYLRRAAILIGKGTAENFEKAEADQAKALELAENKDDIHYQIGRQIANAIQADSTLSYKDWSYAKAADEIQQAIDIKPMAVYYQSLGDLRNLMKDIQGTFEAYLALCHTAEATPDNYVTAALASEQLPEGKEQAIALMDSAAIKATGKAATANEGLTYESAPYVLERALMKARYTDYRASVADFNLYEQLAGTSVNDQFYYLKEQVEANAKMYQQALDDLDTAISINPLPVYLLEKASLNIRVNRIDEALPVLENLVLSYPNDVDCNRMLGFCHAVKGNKAKALPFLKKAVELGDENAANLIERYCK